MPFCAKAVRSPVAEAVVAAVREGSARDNRSGVQTKPVWLIVATSILGRDRFHRDWHFLNNQPH
jgi:hypothetical protein